MKLRYTLSLGVCLNTLVFANIGHAQTSPVTSGTPSSQITYQGSITENGIQLPDGDYTFTVTLYTDAEGITPFWSDNLTARVSQGVFNLPLGSKAALPSPKDMDKPLWLGVRINGKEEMKPLTQFSTVPFAMNVADGAITAAKMSTDYVGALAVDGKQITKKGGTLNLKAINGLGLKYDEASNSLVLMPTGGGKGKSPTWIGMINSNNDAGSPNGTEPTNTIGGGDFNTITATNLYGTIAGGEQNTVSNTHATIGGGYGNRAQGEYSFIGGGAVNQATLDYTTIAGGDNNLATATHSTVGGGQSNSAGGDFSTAGGGFLNIINISASWGTIGGGDNNQISEPQSTIAGGSFNVVNGSDGTVGGGNTNQALNSAATISGGTNNTASGYSSFVGGGSSNQATGNWSAVAGGSNNVAEPVYGFIGGGASHHIAITSNHSAIGGGQVNQILDNTWFSAIAGGRENTIAKDASNSFIGSGEYNKIIDSSPYGSIGSGNTNSIEGLSAYSTIGSGLNNRIYGAAGYAVIAGGRDNEATLNFSTVSGGWLNKSYGMLSSIGGGNNNQTNSIYSHIGGGNSNNVTGNSATISGGVMNIVNDDGDFVGSGLHNRVGINDLVVPPVTNPSPYSTISGGQYNLILSANSTIGGGVANQITASSDASTIAGGNTNTVSSDNAIIGGGFGNTIIAGAHYATIGGGNTNRIASQGNTATIVGGDHLTSNKYAQTVAGFYNRVRNINPFTPPVTVTKTNLYNDPIFMIGNGTNKNTSNAFEVSYNGHSIVTDINNTGTTRGAVRGGTYQDNVVYAWADVPAATGPYPQVIAANTDFGVANITATGPGVYVVTMNLVEPDGSTAFTLSGGSVTATITNDECLAEVYSTPPVGNTFTVFTKLIKMTVAPSPTLYCDRVSLPFMFKVTGRPN